MKPNDKLEQLQKIRQKIGKKLGKKHHELWTALNERQQLHWADQVDRGIAIAEVATKIIERYQPVAEG
jgi:hypothetical protein